MICSLPTDSRRRKILMEGVAGMEKKEGRKEGGKEGRKGRKGGKEGKGGRREF